MDSELSEEDMDYIIGEVRGQLSSMSAAQRRSVARTRDSFTNWLLNAIRAIARTIGKIVAFPFRMLEAFFEGLEEGWNS